MQVLYKEGQESEFVYLVKEGLIEMSVMFSKEKRKLNSQEKEIYNLMNKASTNRLNLMQKRMKVE